MLQALSSDPDHYHPPSRGRPPNSYPIYDEAVLPLPFRASDHQDSKSHLLLTASGSVATIKIPNIVRALANHSNLSIRIVLTPASRNFLAGQSAEQPRYQDLLKVPNVDGIYIDENEWEHPWVRGAPILHIELRRWADLLVIAPLSMDLLAKIVNGFSDSLLASVVRAWDTDGCIDGKKKRIIVALAANTAMYKNPITEKQVSVLENEWGVKKTTEDGRDVGSDEGWFEVLRPQGDKGLACGDVGVGAMRDFAEIVGIIEDRLGLVKAEA